MNRQFLKKIAVVWCYGCMALGLHAQGPLDGYLKGKGVLDLAPSFSLNNSRVFSGAGGRTYGVPFRGSMFSIFAEYGFSNRFDLVVTGAYVFSSTQSGFQDGGIYGKYRPFYKKTGNLGHLGMIVGFGASFPLSDYAPAVAGALGQKAVIAPARLIVQWDTPFGVFFNITGGYNFRFDQLREEDIKQVRKQRPGYSPPDPPGFGTALIKVGFPTAHFYGDIWLERQFTRGGADFQPGVPDLAQAYGVSYNQVGGVLYYSESGKNGVFVSGAYIFSGRNVSHNRRVTLGAVFKFL